MRGCEEAAQRLAAILDEAQADVLAIYDPAGMTGHPDHSGEPGWGAGCRPSRNGQGLRGDDEPTHIQRLVGQAAELGIDGGRLVDLDSFGTPEELIAITVDVRDYLATKRRAMTAHCQLAGATQERESFGALTHSF